MPTQQEEMDKQIKHTAMLVPKGQRELFIFELSQIISLAVAQKEKKIIEIINTVEVKENPSFSANSENRKMAKIINKHLMPAIKEAIINTLKGGK